jgi:hypothetical protein
MAAASSSNSFFIFKFLLLGCYMVRILNVRSAYYTHRFAFVHKKKKKSNESATADPPTGRRQSAACSCLNPTR